MSPGERLRTAVEMLGWAHSDLIAFVRAHSVPGGMFTVSAPLPEPVEVELEGEHTAAGVEVRVIAAPQLVAVGEDGVFLAKAIARRAKALSDVTSSALVASGISAAELADTHGMHLSVLDRIVRGRLVRIDGAIVALDTLIDFVGEVRTTRHEHALMSALRPCTEHHGIGDPNVYEWPNNVLSARTVVLEGGTIARVGDGTVARYLPAERSRCVQLSHEAADRMGGVSVDLRSEGDEPFLPFFWAASSDSVGPPATVDEAYVRGLFGGAICPLDPVRVEPFTESSTFVVEAAADSAERAARFRGLMRFFEQHELTSPTAIEIGFFEYAPATSIAERGRPPGFESRGSCLPRLIIAFTPTGSVVGVFGHAVWT